MQLKLKYKSPLKIKTCKGKCPESLVNDVSNADNASCQGARPESWGKEESRQPSMAHWAGQGKSRMSGGDKLHTNHFAGRLGVPK